MRYDVVAGGYGIGMADDMLTQALDATDEIEITVTGRTSGREHSTPVWFVRERDDMFLVPVDASRSNWFKNVRENPTIRIDARGASLTAHATPITDQAEVDRIVDKFRAKYGADSVERYYPNANVAVDVPLDTGR